MSSVAGGVSNLICISAPELVHIARTQGESEPSAVVGAKASSVNGHRADIGRGTTCNANIGLAVADLAADVSCRGARRGPEDHGAFTKSPQRVYEFTCRSQDNRVGITVGNLGGLQTSWHARGQSFHPIKKEPDLSMARLNDSCAGWALGGAQVMMLSKIGRRCPPPSI